MPIGVITRDDQGGQRVQAPVFIDRISFAGDGTYPAGGTPDFQTLVRAKTGDSREIIDIIPGNCGVYLPMYDKANDKLFVYDRTTNAESAVANMSGTTFNLTVISQ